MTEKTKIVFIGDNISKGTGLKDPSKSSIPAKLNEYMGTDYVVLNKSVNESCVLNIKKLFHTYGNPYARSEEYKSALEENASIYVIFLGTNDSQDGFDRYTGYIDKNTNLIQFEDQFEESYQEILDKIFEKKINRHNVFVVSPIPIDNTARSCHKENNLRKIISHIKNTAQKNKVVYIDLHSEFEKYQNDNKKKYYQQNGISPNEEGADVIASILAYHISNREY